MLSASHVNLIGRMVVVSVVNSHHYDAKIVINCVPTYTPDRGRYWVIHRNLRSNRNYSEI